MENKKTLVIIIICLVIGIIVGYAFEELLGEESEEGEEKISLGFEEPYEPVIDPENFVDKIDNKYLPYTPGTKYTYEGETEDGLERNEVIVTNETKQILGVTCTVVRDTVKLDGELIEDTFDWYAQDKDGNVWYFGEDSKEYEDGKVISTAGSWESGIDGAQPGIIMLTHPLVGVTYRQEYYENEAEDFAQIVSLNESESVQFGGTYSNLLMTSEWTPLEPDITEHKYYADGIGVILEVMVKGGSERMELVNFIVG